MEQRLKAEVVQELRNGVLFLHAEDAERSVRGCVVLPMKPCFLTAFLCKNRGLALL
jgi:hypothetical protein